MKQKKLISIGIDPAPSSNSLCVIDKDLNILELRTTPYFTRKSSTRVKTPKLNRETGRYEKAYREQKYVDYTKFREVYEPYLNNKYEIIYAVERVFVKKGEGEQQSFIFGTSVGVNLGIYALLQPTYFNEISPTIWKPYFGLDSDKEKSVVLVNQIFEKQLKKKFGKLLKYQVSNSNKNADMAEAALIALYNLILYKEEKEGK